MMNKFFKAVTALCVLGASLQVNAAIISVDGVEVEALDIDQSFESFYDFTDWSANTGYEIANELVAFFATDDTDALGLYMIFGGPGGDAGEINFDINSPDGNIVFVDDPSGFDPVVATPTGFNIDFSYAADKTDGLVYSDFSSESWFLDVIFNSFSGISGFSFLTFDSNGDSSVAVSGSTLSDLVISSVDFTAPPAPTAVNTPSTMMIFLLSLSCLFLSRRKFK